MRTIIKGKKGDITDMLSFLVTIIGLAIGLFIMAWVIPKITDGLNSANLNNSAEGKAAIQKLEDYGYNGIQKGFFWLFIGLCIATLISAFYVDTHPVWLVIYIIILGITIVLAAYLANAYEQVILNPAFEGFEQGYITMIISNIVRILVGVGAASIVIIFGKWAYFSGGSRF